MLDLEKEMIYTKELNNINRATTITWTNDGDMILAAPQNGGAKNRNNIILKRGSSTDGQDFKESSWVALARGNACNGSMVLPQTGELYFNHRATGNVYRYNFEENGYNNNPEVPGGAGLNDFWHLVYLIRRLTLVWFLIQQVNMFISSCMNRIIYFVPIMMRRLKTGNSIYCVRTIRSG